MSTPRTASGLVTKPGPATPQQDGLAYVREVDSAEMLEETVDQTLTRVSQDCGDGVALMWLTDAGLGTMTWSELCARARAAGATLLELNPERGRVALAAPNSVDWIVAMFGCAMAGMAVVPISPMATNNEARHIVSQAHAKLILAAARVGDRTVYDNMCELTRQLSWPVAVRDIAGLDRSATYLRPAEARPSDEFLIQHTSGTTGQPKAAVLSHRAALNSGRVWGKAVGLQAGESWLNPLPLHHVGGSVSGLLTALTIGGTYFIVERFTPESVLQALRVAQPTAVGLVPTMIIDLLAVPGVSPADFTSLRTIAGGAAAVDRALIEDMERRLGVTCMVGYGQSEAPAMTASAPSDPTTVRTQTLGHCLPGRDLYISGPDGRVMPTGSIGELCVRGPLTMSGYLRSDGSIDPAVDDAGWLHTGDLCSMDGDGVLTFRGRLREVIIRGGENIYPAEVEQVLAGHSSVAEAAVFGVPDDRLGERVIAVVLPTAGQIDVRELDAFAESQLSRHKRPAEWIVAEALPRTSTGKVRKHLLRQCYEDGTLDTS